MKWLYLHFPHLYMEHHYRHLSPDHPLALKAEHGNSILACNQAARSAGIDEGMLLNTAFCLCPGLGIETWWPHKACMALANLGQRASEVSGWVSLDHPDGLYLEIASMRRFFGSYSNIKEHVSRLFSETGHTFNLAVAPNPKAARLLSRNGSQGWLNQTRLQERFQDIPVQSLNMSESVLFRLQKIGIKTVDELIQLPLQDIAYRISEDLAMEVRHLTGKLPWEPAIFQPPEIFSWHVDMEQEFDSLTQLRFPITHGLKKFCQFMQERCCITSNLSLFLLQNEGGESPVRLNLAMPDNRLESWVYRLNICIEKTPLATPVTGFRLEACDFIPVPKDTLSLFAVSGYSEQDKSLLINRMATRLGIDRIHFLGLSEDARPEKQTVYSLQPLQENPGIDPFSLRPVWLLAEPAPINIEHYTLLRGPLRIASGWEDNGAINRDYYVAKNACQALHWVFITPQHRWMWHGIFS
jgi:protein ImuB